MAVLKHLVPASPSMGGSSSKSHSNLKPIARPIMKAALQLRVCSKRGAVSVVVGRRLRLHLSLPALQLLAVFNFLLRLLNMSHVFIEQ